MIDVLLVAATERELGGRDGLVCGVGPVDAAGATARALALRSWSAVLHVGVAGGRRIAPGTLVIGAESVYSDLEAKIRVVDRVPAEARLVAAARAVLPQAPVIAIGTSAAVGGTTDPGLRAEAMEGFGVLRAAMLAGVPAIEVRAISNEIGEADRGRWEIVRALDAISAEVPALLAGIVAALRP